MITIENCIISLVKAQNPCSINAIRKEVKMQQTEVIKIDAFYLDLEIEKAIQEVLLSGQLTVTICESEILIDLP